MLGSRSTNSTPNRMDPAGSVWSKWDKMQPNRLQRAVELLEENLQEEPADDRNIRLWIQGARFLPNPPTIEVAAERVAYWRANGDSTEATYYSYVLQAL